MKYINKYIGREALYLHRSYIVKYNGVITRENVGISNVNISKKLIHRKIKVSLTMLII